MVTPTNAMWQRQRQSHSITRVTNYSLPLKVTKIQEKLSHKYDAWTRAERLSIVNAAFSASEKQRVKGHELIITMCINSDTGKVDEVEFSFMNFGTYATIPISVYRKIETDLKEKVWYIPTEEGKKLNYIYYWWAQEPQ